MNSETGATMEVACGWPSVYSETGATAEVADGDEDGTLVDEYDAADNEEGAAEVAGVAVADAVGVVAAGVVGAAAGVVAGAVAGVPAGVEKRAGKVIVTPAPAHSATANCPAARTMLVVMYREYLCINDIPCKSLWLVHDC